MHDNNAVNGIPTKDFQLPLNIHPFMNEQDVSLIIHVYETFFDEGELKELEWHKELKDRIEFANKGRLLNRWDHEKYVEHLSKDYLESIGITKEFLIKNI